MAFMALSVASSVVQGVGALQAGIAQQKEFNRQAAMQIQKGEFDAAQAETRYHRTRGTAIANASGEGIDVASISDVLADSAIEAALERKAIRFGARAEADNLRAQGRAARRQGQQAFVGSLFSAGGSIFKSKTF